MTSTIATYQMISNNIVRQLQQTAKRPDVSRDTDYYLQHIGQVKTIDQFLGDYRLYSYAMKAFGLSDMTYAKAFMRKVLTEGVTSSTSFANKLVDKRYRDFAAAFNFASLGDRATSTTAATTGTVSKYVRQTLEEDAGSQSEGVRLALYFERKAPSITNVMQILSDKALLQVAQTALDISPMTSMAAVDKQATMLAKQINVADFKDPAKLRTFLQRFSAMWDMQNTDAASSSPALTIITGGQSSDMGLNADILTSLQNLKLGR
ncbi:DUF1217 domain-containing protein [Bradyrhizobium sp. 2TAF24]|uniref:DUF1217 domain-containing protein n=1 Tax=Bradyrhizobium sp. 2TAF24 TaxID=3233011 RepID=UPI003F91AB7E